MKYENLLKQTIQAKKDWLSAALEEETKAIYEENNRFKISDEDYQRLILPYWSKYSLSPKKFYFEYNGSRDQIIDPRFIPEDLYYCELIPYLNNCEFKGALTDKCYFDILFPEIRQPETICKRISGEYYDRKMQLITENEAISLCHEHKKSMIIKKSIHSSKGKDIKIIDDASNSCEGIRQIFAEMGANFIVQEFIDQHPILSKLGSFAVHTIRIATLFLNGQVHLQSACLKIGLPGQRWLSLSQKGGYLCQINKDGTLNPTLLSALDGKWVDAGKINLFEPGFTIPSYDAVCKAAMKLHLRLPHFKFIGWDFSVDGFGEPVLIEYNVAPGLSQIECGEPVFGEMTDYILDDFFIHKRLQKNHRQNILIQQ